MAIDTRERRASAAGFPWAPNLPAPDASVDTADRPMVAGVYSGLTYVVVVVVPTAEGLGFSVPTQRLHYEIDEIRIHASVKGRIHHETKTGRLHWTTRVSRLHYD